VRVTEALVRKAQKTIEDVGATGQVKEKVFDRDALRLQEAITDFLGAKTTIKHKRNGQGSVVIDYSNLDELDGIVSRFNLKHDF